MVFDIPPQVDEFLTNGFLLLFIISFLINTYMFSEISLDYIKECHHVVPNYNMTKYDRFTNNFEYNLQQITNSAQKKSSFAFYSKLILYWIVIPFVCFYYSFKFNKSMWPTKHLNSSHTLKNYGV